jgi:4-alpha-glucanotransferase
LRENWGGPFSEEDIATAAKKIFSKCLTQVGSEELWQFKKKIQGEKDIDALKLHPGSRACLFRAWQNRTFLEYEKGRFFPVCYYGESRAYKSLSNEEKQSLEALLERHKAKSEKVWAVQGKKFLNVLRESSSMLPCAEDLGAVPNCVPVVLAKLKILGLRVVRWFREWDKDGKPYIPLDQYPEMSVCTTAVHDSSTLRQWWEDEAEREYFSGFIGHPSLPKTYEPGTAKAILYKTATAKSRFRVFQIQDLLHLSPRWYAADPALERINVPGTCNDFNWTYRLPASIEEIGKDKDLIKAVLGMVKGKPEAAAVL